MARYEVTFKDRSVEVIEDADAYQQEGPMTTFFATGPGRQVVDCWSTRLASFRTGEVIIIRRVEAPAWVTDPSSAPPVGHHLAAGITAAVAADITADITADGAGGADDEVVTSTRRGVCGSSRAVVARSTYGT